MSCRHRRCNRKFRQRHSPLPESHAPCDFPVHGNQSLGQVTVVTQDDASCSLSTPDIGARSGGVNVDTDSPRWDDDDSDMFPFDIESVPNNDSVVTEPCTFSVGRIARPNLTCDEMAMLDMMLLLDNNGANRGLYNELISLLRRHSRLGFTPSNAKSRENFLRDMREKVHVPEAIKCTV